MPYGYGNNGCGTPGMEWMGAWDAQVVYAKGHAVSCNGSSYVSDANGNQGYPPDTSEQWDLLAGKGDPGAPGPSTSIWYNGSGAPSNELGADGDYYLDTNNADTYQKSSGAWSFIGSIRGQQGDPGAPAAWHNGSGAPGSELGVDGDHYLDTDSGDVYVKSGGSWSQTGNVKGPQGDQGPAGAGVEVGDVKWVAHGNVPAGWMECNGQGVSASQYPDLFAKLGYMFGGYDDTFNLPDLQDRVVLSKSGSRSIGNCGGEETHYLTTDEMPSHEHGGGEVSGYVDVSGCISGVAGFSLNCCAFCDSNATSCAITGVSGSDGYSNTMPVCGTFCGSGSFSGYMQTSSCGGGWAHNNMQPYLVLMAVIKVAA